MKIRYYTGIDGWRWLGFVLVMFGALYYQMQIYLHSG